MERNKLYGFVLMLSLIGFVWLFMNEADFGWLPFGCLFHKVTGLPCPACGSTRAVLALIGGHFHSAFYINPLGILTATMAVVFPLWIILDLLIKKDSFYRFYKKSEEVIRKKGVAILLIFLFLMNWLWNISKNL